MCEQAYANGDIFATQIPASDEYAHVNTGFWYQLSRPVPFATGSPVDSSADIVVSSNNFCYTQRLER